MDFDQNRKMARQLGIGSVPAFRFIRRSSGRAANNTLITGYAPAKVLIDQVTSLDPDITLESSLNSLQRESDDLLRLNDKIRKLQDSLKGLEGRSFNQEMTDEVMRVMNNHSIAF